MTDNEYESYVAEFSKGRIKEEEDRTERAYIERERFLSLFPIESILSMSLNDYAFAKSGYGNKNSFCCLMKSGLENVAHSGNSMPDIYGIYYSNGVELKLSRTYKNLCGEDTEKAFEIIKNEIYQLLVRVAEDDYSVVDEVHLESRFLHKILAVYFPDKFLPICVLPMRDEVFEAMEMDIDNSQDMLFDNIRLRKLKESHESTKNYDNEVFLGFCRWVGQQKGNVIPAAQRIKMAVQRANKIEDEIEELGVVGEEKEAIAKIRVNQDIYREELLKKYNTCALCKVSDPHLLVASHIKPWADSSPEEKLDIDNGFMFCPNHDKLFDRGYISFNDDGTILISSEIDKINQTFMNVAADMKADISEGQKDYLRYHRENIFKG